MYKSGRHEKTFDAIWKRLMSSKKVPKSNRATITKFDNELKAINLSLSARIHYAKLFELLSEHTTKPHREITKEDLIGFLGSMESRYAEGSMVTYRACLRRFYKWLEGDDEEYPKKVRWIKARRGTANNKLPEEMVTPEEIKKMANAATRPRDRSIVMVLYESGCRISEFLSVNLKHVQLDKYGAVLIVKGKTGMRRIRLISSVPDLLEWMNHHPDRDNPEAPLWTSLGRGYGKLLGREGVNQMLYKLAERAKVKKRVHAHMLRHSRLTELAKTFTESELKIIAGWSGDSRMPKTYIHLSGEDVEKKFLEMHGLLDRKDEKKEKSLTPLTCPRCGETNSPASKFCTKCSMVLDLKTAVSVDKKRVGRDKLIEELVKDSDMQKFLIKKLLKKGNVDEIIATLS